MPTQLNQGSKTPSALDRFLRGWVTGPRDLQSEEDAQILGRVGKKFSIALPASSIISQCDLSPSQRASDDPRRDLMQQATGPGFDPIRPLQWDV